MNNTTTPEEEQVSTTEPYFALLDEPEGYRVYAKEVDGQIISAQRAYMFALDLLHRTSLRVYIMMAELSEDVGLPPYQSEVSPWILPTYHKSPSNPLETAGTSPTPLP